LIEIKSRKVQLGKGYKQERAPGAQQTYLLFAPDGALVTLRGTTCTIQEPGKDKPRTSFELRRAAEHQKKEYWFNVQDAVVSPDGSQLAVAADGTIIVYDLTTGKKLFAEARAAPEPKKGGDPFPGNASLAYTPSANDPKLLAVETVVGTQEARKDFVLARQFDLKNLKEMGKWSIPTPPGKGGPILGDPNGLAKQPGEEYSRAVSAYYTAKSEPHILYHGKVFDGASGKQLYKFNPGTCTFVSRDGKALVRVTKTKKEGKTMVVEVWSLDTAK
jgi:hypothetical protein